MKIILIQDVAEVGHRGDVVEVSPGYARNFLLPRSLAVKATAGALRDAEAIRAARAAVEQKLVEAANEMSQALSGTTVVVAARAADEGRLFGSIGARDVAEAIAKYTGIAVPAEQIRLAGPIKEIGLHAIEVRPHAEVDIQLTLDVIPA
ncbi:MAG: 50S ribosomal protein L9 [Actinobacteria bacterium RBG_16_68_21]|nr:MAG: 50S ribosomal protein L9 [Actinobacteria bacterium RBG_16_68_21]